MVWVKEAEALRTTLIYKNEIDISFEKLLTNMQIMFTGLYENGEIINDSHKIRLLFQKFQNPILTQIKVSIQIYYDMDQANTVTYDFIYNSLEAEAVRIGDHNTQGVTDVNTCGEKAPESGVKGAGGAIFTGFYPNCSKPLDVEKQYIFDKSNKLNIKVGTKCKSFDKKKISGLHPSIPKK